MVAGLLPEGVRPVLMGDRFYGSPDLIDWCRAHGWDWRLRLKQDLLVFQGGGEATLADCLRRGEHMLIDVELTGKKARTNIVMALALFWAVSTGMWASVHAASPDEKRSRQTTQEPLARPDVVLQTRYSPHPDVSSAIMVVPPLWNVWRI